MIKVMESSFFKLAAILAFVLISGTSVSGLNYDNALILSTREEFPEFENYVVGEGHSIQRRSPSDNNVQVHSFKVQSDIKYRYSRTCITSQVLNRDLQTSHEVTFQVVLPETAFISNFNMEIDGKIYEAYVKEKDEAKRVYNEAQMRGQSAGLVELNARHSNVFSVNLNVKAESKVNFNLTYEELLQRRLGRYEQIININPDQITNLGGVEIIVNIQESQDIALIYVPKLRNEIEETSTHKNKEALIERPTKNTARITWIPSKSDQERLRKIGQIGKFVFQYDTARELDDGEVLIMNGYFVHFFAPKNLKPLQKHVVFVLDISGSMMGRKIEQLREAMKKILSDLKSDDFLNIIIFSSDVTHWAPGDTFVRRRYNYDFHHLGNNGNDDSWKKQPFAANRENILQAQNFIESLPATDGTNIHDALISALDLISNIKTTRKYYYTESYSPSHSGRRGLRKRNKRAQHALPGNVESLIIFLTDGEPTVGVTGLSDILSRIRSANARIDVPIFSLAFGTGADFTFLRRLSLQNHAFARKIYEAADAAIQLKGFYNEIASPLLSNVKFNYTSPDYDADEVTNARFATLFDGCELAVAGKISPRGAEEDDDGRSKRSVSRSSSLMKYVPNDECYFPTYVEARGRDGRHTWGRPIVYSHWQWWCHPHPHHPVPTTTRRPVIITPEDSFLERLWAYLTIQQLIDKDFAQDGQNLERSGESPKERALRLSLTYGFVTSLTSLVVVKPSGSEDETGAFSADKKSSSQTNSFAGQPLGGFHRGASAKLKSYRGPRPMSFDHAAANGGAAPSDSFLTRPSAPAAEEREESEPEAGEADNDDETSVVKPTKADESKIEKKDRHESPKPARGPPVKDTSSKSLTLNDILWLSDYDITVKHNGVLTKFTIAQDDSGELGGTDVGKECRLPRSGRNRKGQCKHLKDCIRSAFLDDFELYKKSYFCPIQDLKTDHSFYAGSCCAKH